MQDFSNRRKGCLRSQETEPAPKPYQLYQRDQNLLIDSQRVVRDFEYFKSMYPMGAKRLQQYVEEVCDEMEYEGSPIYDEYPDRVLIEQMIEKIRGRAADQQTWEHTETPVQPAEKPKAESSLPDPADESSLEEAQIQEFKTRPQSRGVRVSYGPVCGECRKAPEGYQIWETAPVRIQETGEFLSRGPSRPPQGPWGPSRPPQGPWGPPPSPQGPWGPPPSPQGPWGPPPQGPWGPPPPNRPGSQNFFGDLLSVLLFNELQGRRCRSGRCR